MNKNYEIIIIGSGIVGTTIARELSRFTSSILLLEKQEDVGMGVTRANSGIIHGGYSAKHGTCKGDLSIEGNRMYRGLSKQLGFPYDNIGSLVLGFTDEDEAKIEALLENGRANGVHELSILTKDEVLRREPLVSDRVRCALYCGETGIASPYEAAIAFAENAVSHGVTLLLNHEVTGIEQHGDLFTVSCGTSNFSSPAVINAAGLFSDRVAAMVGADTFSIIPRKGDYLLLKRDSSWKVNSVIFQTPTEKGKGILVSPTTWQNLLIGPDAEQIDVRQGYNTTYEALKAVLEQARISLPQLKLSSLIRYFTGIRPTPDTRDFIIGQSAVPGFFQAAGIESPGLTSAPAIAVRIRKELIDAGFITPENRSFNPERTPITTPEPLKPFNEIKDDIDRPIGDPERVVCRCEQVRERTITDALDRNIPIDSLDAVKRRTRAGMGACQGAFCGPRVKHLLHEHTGIDEDKIRMPVKKDAELLKRLRKL